MPFMWHLMDQALQLTQMQINYLGVIEKLWHLLYIISSHLSEAKKRRISIMSYSITSCVSSRGYNPLKIIDGCEARVSTERSTVTFKGNVHFDIVQVFFFCKLLTTFGPFIHYQQTYVLQNQIDKLYQNITMMPNLSCHIWWTNPCSYHKCR